MMATKQSWGKLLGRMLLHGVILGVCVFVAVHAAMAREGERGGHTRTFLTVAGSITVRSGVTPHLTFIFEKVDPLSDAGAAAGPSVVCTVTNASTQYNTSTGSFSSEIPIDACPGSMFDGANVWVTTVVRDGSVTGAELLRTERRPLNPVPYARYADQYGTPDCPVGYEQAMDATPPRRSFCRGRGNDEVVRVGSGPSAFWIDRYEATVWTSRDGFLGSSPGVSQFEAADDFDQSRFPRNGQWRNGMASSPPVPPVFALSINTGRVQPARYITWFQALEACRTSGKRLPTAEEWLAAAQGTVDPGSNDGSRNTACNTAGGGPRVPGGGTGCESGWGAQDMVGNVAEWTSEWFAGAGAITSPTLTLPDGGVVLAPPRGSSSVTGARVNPGVNQWPVGYNSDGTWNITSVVDRGTGAGEENIAGIPAAGIRGGAWDDAAAAGVFNLNLNFAPSAQNAHIGFRCVIPR